MGTRGFLILSMLSLTAQPLAEAGARRAEARMVVSRIAPNTGIKRTPDRSGEFVRDLVREAQWVAEISMRPSRVPHQAVLRVRQHDWNNSDIFTQTMSLQLHSWGERGGKDQQAIIVAGPHLQMTHVHYDGAPAAARDAYTKTLGGVLVRAKYFQKPRQRYLELRSPYEGPDGDVFFSATDEGSEPLRVGFNNGTRKVWLNPGDTGTVELDIPPAQGGDVIRFDTWVDDN